MSLKAISLLQVSTNVGWRDNVAEEAMRAAKEEGGRIGIIFEIVEDLLDEFWR